MSWSTQLGFDSWGKGVELSVGVWELGRPRLNLPPHTHIVWLVATLAYWNTK